MQYKENALARAVTLTGAATHQLQRNDCRIAAEDRQRKIFAGNLYFCPGLCKGKGKRGRGMSAADQHKEKIICMLESINDEKFLNQIRTLLKLHIEKKGKQA